MRFLSDFFTLLIYQAIFYAARLTRKTSSGKTLLLIKTDEIGDYVLFRNLLSYFRESPKYHDHRIVLVGNKICRQLFDAYDAHAVDEVMWLDKVSFKSSIGGRYQFLRQVRQVGASTAINLIYSRNYRTDDVLMAVCGAREKIAMAPDLRSQSALERLFTPRIYNNYLPVPATDKFESWRNAEYVEALTGLNNLPVTTTIPMMPGRVAEGLPTNNYCVIFPGSGRADKKWPARNFATVAAYMHQRFAMAIMICGGPGDLRDVEELTKLLKIPFENVAGRTSLPRFLEILESARCLVSVDTGAVHLAAAVHCPVFALFSGKHYGRFAPYPKTVSDSFFPVYPTHVVQDIQSGLVGSRHYNDYPNQAIANIPVDHLIAPIDIFFNAASGSVEAS